MNTEQFKQWVIENIEDISLAVANESSAHLITAENVMVDGKYVTIGDDQDGVDLICHEPDEDDMEWVGYNGEWDEMVINGVRVWSYWLGSNN